MWSDACWREWELLNQAAIAQTDEEPVAKGTMPKLRNWTICSEKVSWHFSILGKKWCLILLPDLYICSAILRWRHNRIVYFLDESLMLQIMKYRCKLCIVLLAKIDFWLVQFLFISLFLYIICGFMWSVGEHKVAVFLSLLYSVCCLQYAIVFATIYFAL